MSRAVILAGVAAAALAAPALAADPYYPQAPAGSPLYQPAPMITANFDVAGGIVFGSGDVSGTSLVMSGIGRVNLLLPDAWNLQVDVQGIAESTYDFIGGSGPEHSDIALTGYLYKRSGGWAMGPAISFEQRGSIFDKFFSVIYGLDPTFGPWEVHGYVQAGAVTNAGKTGTLLAGQIGALYWLDNNTELGGDVMVSNFNTVGSTTVVTVAAHALHRLDGWPIALFGNARLDSYSGATSGTAATLMVGSRFYINPTAPDARTDMETGPAFTTRLPLPLL